MTESPESQLLGAGFVSRLGFWVTPDGSRTLGRDDAIAALESGEVQPGGSTVTVPTNAVALTDEHVERLLHPEPPPPPAWVVRLQESIDELLAELKGRSS